jgi:PDZ domain-containing protein
MQSRTDIHSQPPQGPPPLASPSGTSNSLWRWLAIVLVGLVLGWAAYNVPIPAFYAYQPGPARDVEKLVDVSGERTYSSDGSLYLTTVSVDINVTLTELVSAGIDPAKAIVSKDEITGGKSFEDLEKAQLQEMENSKEQARVVALTALGYPEPTGKGAEIVDVDGRAPAGGRLEEGDLITGVNGNEVETTCDASEFIGDLPPGEVVELTLLRRGQEKTVTLDTAENPNDPSKAYVGVRMTNPDGFEYDPGIDVEFQTGEIAGPSAGLMFTLALYDQLTPDDLTSGREIAGTGTIGCGGEVGPIGGIEQKVVGAEAAGAEVFLAPADNYQAALTVADGIEVVEVGNFEDALEYLEHTP